MEHSGFHPSHGLRVIAAGLLLGLACGGGGSSGGGHLPPSTEVAPTILTQPASQSVTAGQTATFNVVAAGTAPLTYQWKKGAAAISGATQASYTTPITQAADDGSTFAVTVSNGQGSISSQTATLSVAAGVVNVQVSPDATVLQPGASFRFTATVSGSTNTEVTWSVSETGGGTVDASGTYAAPASEGTFHVIATSAADGTTHASATVHVSASLLIPPERITIWNPGLNAVGGIPNRTTLFGAMLMPSGGDDTAAIQAALDQCPADHVVKLGPGTFHIQGGGLYMGTSHITLRGSGSNQTKLIKGTGTNAAVISFGVRDLKDQVALAADALKGTNTVTLAGAPPSGVPLAVGELVVIDHVTNSLSWWNPDPQRSPGGGPSVDQSRGWFCEYDRPIGQVLEIQAIHGNQLTFTTGFHTDFRLVDQPQLARYWKGDKVLPVTSPVQWSGVEDLYVAFGEGGDGGGNIHLSGVKYCWVKNVESDQSKGTSVNLDGTFRCTVRDSYIHSTVWPAPGGNGYGIGVNSYAADNLVENNISWNFNKVMVMRASGGGNVIGYNYLQDGWGHDYPNQMESGMNASHYTTPHYELFEGNESFAFSADSTWGNSIYITVFRNSMTTTRTKASPLNTFSYSLVDGTGTTLTFYYEDEYNRNAVGIGSFHHHYNFLGNVLGAPHMALLADPRSAYKVPQTAWVYEEDGVDGHVPMWSLGLASDAYIVADPQVKATMLRHGNFDYVKKATVWDSGIANQALPASLYLNSKPAFMGSAPWPWVTPENEANPLPGMLPAKVRFEAIQAGTGF